MKTKAKRQPPAAPPVEEEAIITLEIPALLAVSANLGAIARAIDSLAYSHLQIAKAIREAFVTAPQANEVEQPEEVNYDQQQPTE